MTGQSQAVNDDLIESYAEDSLRLFQINLIIFTIVLSALALVYEGATTQYLERFFSSIYTLTAGLLWMGSMVASVFSYRSSRHLILRGNYRNEGVLPDENNHLNTVSAVAVSSLLCVLSLVFGFLDALGEGGVPIDQPFFVVVFSLVFVSVSFNLFSFVDYLRGTAPQWVWDLFYGRWDSLKMRLESNGEEKSRTNESKEL